VAEPTGERVALAHRGFVWLEVVAHGRAAHGSRPELGIDAIAKMGRVLTGLEDLDRALRASPSHPLLGSGSLHASVIQGGRELSTYPDRCELRLERRTVPGETPATVEREVGQILERAAAHDPDFRADVAVTFAREPFQVAEDADVVAAVRRQAGGAEVVGVPFWTDAAVLAAAGIPTVLFGPVGEGAHADVEWVDLDSTARCAELYLAVARELCA
jgi:acetylornithine deacetylase